MNILEEFHKHPERVLDRLVDGELGQSQRRDLLAALDDEPSGWRTCALAFLEAQNFRWQFARLAAEQSLAPGSAATGSVAPGESSSGSTSARHGRGWWRICLSVAASLLLAFGLGTRFPTASPPASSSLSPQTAEEQVAEAPEAVAQDPVWEDLLDDDLHSVTLAITGGEDSDSIELPVAVADEDPQQWLDDLENALPAVLIERLRDAGFEVVRRQRLYPVELSDGRRLVVPVEQVDIRDPGAVESL